MLGRSRSRAASVPSANARYSAVEGAMTRPGSAAAVRPGVEQRHGAEARPRRRGREVGALPAGAEVQRAAEGAAGGRRGHRRRPGRRRRRADGVRVIARVARGDGHEDPSGVGVEGRGLGRVDARRVVRVAERQVDDVDAVAHGGVDRADDVDVRAIAHLPARLVDGQVRAGRHAGDAVDAERVAVDAGIDAGVADASSCGPGAGGSRGRQRPSLARATPCGPSADSDVRPRAACGVAWREPHHRGQADPGWRHPSRSSAAGVGAARMLTIAAPGRRSQHGGR
jgi:hypothetical protein